MSEFSLIEKYCQGLGVSHAETRVSVGDDAAVVAVPEGMELVTSVDTMVEGVHFFADVNPHSLAQKLVAVNVSDMAAMGAEPRWATLALTVNHSKSSWLSGFSAGLDAAANQFGVQLIGGDTTAGPLTLSLQIMGVVPAGTAILRTGAKPSDLVYVSGVLGDAALALKLMQSGADAVPVTLQRALELPKPQLELGVGMRGLVSSAIDISDGLVADLGHIANASDVSLEVDVELVPQSDQLLLLEDHLELALYGGDDYQLAMTVTVEKEQQLIQLANRCKVPLTRIGRVVERTAEPVRLLKGDKAFKVSSQPGYNHFVDA